MPDTATEPTDVRAQLLATATRLFARDGYEATSLSAIAREVGIRKPSLLYHFSSKDALRDAVLEGLLGHWRDVLPRIALAASGGPERLDAILAEVQAFFGDDPSRARLLLRELLDRPDAMRDLIAAHVAPWLDMLASYIARGQREAVVREDVDPVAFILQVTVLIMGHYAVEDGMAHFLPAGASGDGRRRLRREIERIARAALFTSTPSVSHEPARRAEE